MKYTPEKYCRGWRVGSNGHCIKRKRDAVAISKLLNKYGDWIFTATLSIEIDGYIIQEDRECYIVGDCVRVKANCSHFEREAYGDIEFSDLASVFIKETLVSEIN